MSGIYIWLCILLIFSLIITQKVKINIQKHEIFILEFHFIFLALQLKTRKREKKRSLSFRFYSRLVARIFELSRASEIEIREIVLSVNSSDSERTAFTKPYRYNTLISTAIAHLSATAKRLTLSDNAFILLPDCDYPFGFSVTAWASLYDILRVLLPWLFDLLKEKRKEGKKEKCRKLK